MGVIKRMRKQTAVLWTLIGSDPTALDVSWDAPVQVPVRWQETQGASEEAARLKHLGEVLRYTATVFVDRDVRNGDHLLLGELGPDTSADPRLEESWEVNGFDKTPNFKARDSLRVAYAVPTFKTLMVKNGRGVIPITYHHVTGSAVDAGMTVTQTTQTVEVPLAGHTRPDTKLVVGDGKPQARGGGRGVQTVVDWEIPKVYLPFQPTTEDWFSDAGGSRYDVLGVTEGTIRSAWFLPTRSGA